MVEFHPVQVPNSSKIAMVSTVITLRAYEVYKHVYGDQPAIVTGNCRGGFSVGELIVFLYAYSFPKEEWKIRVEEALKGMTGL